MARRRRPTPLPLRDGVDATRIVLRANCLSENLTIGAALLATPSLFQLTPETLENRAAAGEIVDFNGKPVSLSAAATPNQVVYLYRDLPEEVPVPFDLPIIFHDDNLVVVDKPHFLATMPRGAHVTETALVRLRRLTGNAELSPIHRLDRLTAGVLMFSARAEIRAAYQQLFAERNVEKHYQAIAPTIPREFPVTVKNRIIKDSGDLRARVEDGNPNAESTIDVVEVGPQWSRYQLHPLTGRTHQLRLHMSLLGAPIVGDPLYPVVNPELLAQQAGTDFTEPLRLLAYRIKFIDPLTQQEREFISERNMVMS